MIVILPDFGCCVRFLMEFKLEELVGSSVNDFNVENKY